MRFFRIPAFTGIETHRDDMDRGSLRTVEGCVPHGPGGLRSGPVWSKIGDVSQFSAIAENHVSAADDGKGNSLFFVSRESEVHDLLVTSTENTALVSLGASYGVINNSVFDQGDASLTPVGNRLYALGDGSEEAVVTIGEGPPHITHSVTPDQTLYSQEWSRFPNCQFYVAGPKKTIFAAGNPADPLVVYISEPAGVTQPVRDNPYSTYETGHYEGVLSEVRILGSNASKITALSTRQDRVVVHTDKGCHILYAPSPDQASTGYRTEQVSATNTSAAVNSQTVAGDGGTQPFWLGHDGQIYKDEAAVRGAEDFKSYADPQQASWKAKGKWEKEHPANLENSFATYDPQSGMYWVFVESSESPVNTRKPTEGPTSLSGIVKPVNGPTGLGAITAPTDGPTGLVTQEIVTPTSGPTGLVTQEIVAPTSGPTGLSATQYIVAPANGPTGLSATQQVVAPTSGPTGLSATQQASAPASGPTVLTATAMPFPHLHYLIPGTPSYAGDKMYATGLTYNPTLSTYHINNFGYQSFTNVATPTQTSELAATANTGSTCNVEMSMYFPGGGLRHFLRSNSTCSFYQHWIEMTYAGLLDLDVFIATTATGATGNWNAGFGSPAWHYQEVDASTGGVWDVWVAAGNTTGVYNVVKRLGSNSAPFFWTMANASAGSPMGIPSVGAPAYLPNPLGSGQRLEMFISSGAGTHNYATSENRYFDHNNTTHLLPV